jgi:hypothetical protein
MLYAIIQIYQNNAIPCFSFRRRKIGNRKLLNCEIIINLQKVPVPPILLSIHEILILAIAVSYFLLFAYIY